MSIMGILGMFGEIYFNIEKSIIYIVVFLFLYVIWLGNIVILINGKKIGECIWLDNLMINI